MYKPLKCQPDTQTYKLCIWLFKSEIKLPFKFFLFFNFWFILQWNTKKDYFNLRLWLKLQLVPLNKLSFFTALEHVNLPLICHYSRLRVVSNFGGDDRGAGEIHTRARAKFRRHPMRRKRRNFRRSLRVASPRNFARVRVYFARPTIAIAKIRDYSQSITTVYLDTMTNLPHPQGCAYLHVHNIHTCTGLQIIFLSWKDVCPTKSLFWSEKTEMRSDVVVIIILSGSHFEIIVFYHYFLIIW